ncbi:MAG: hypothetical protein V4439_00315 [Patescibacteria group bacterium]
MKRFLQVWSILILIIGVLESLPLLTESNGKEMGQALLVGLPMIIEGAYVLVYLGRKNKRIEQKN